MQPRHPERSSDVPTDTPSAYRADEGRTGRAGCSHTDDHTLSTPSRREHSQARPYKRRNVHTGQRNRPTTPELCRGWTCESMRNSRSTIQTADGGVGGGSRHTPKVTPCSLTRDLERGASSGVAPARPVRSRTAPRHRESIVYPVFRRKRRQFPIEHETTL